jgi:hypothetical protein
MAEPSPNPIPDDLRQAFRDAVSAFRHWDRGGPEPDGTSFRLSPQTVSSVCLFAEAYNDPMANDDYEYLCREEADSSSLLLQGDRSHRAGSQCLSRLVQRRKAHYEATHKKP